MDSKKFADYDTRIRQTLETRGFSLYSDETPAGEYLLLANFVNPLVQDEISGNLVVGGQTLPMVVIIHRVSGEVKHFALKHLVPDFPLD